MLNIALFEQVRELDSLVVLAGPLQLSLGGSLGPTLPITATVILHRLNFDSMEQLSAKVWSGSYVVRKGY